MGLRIHFPSRRKLLRLAREGSRVARTMVSSRCSPRVAAEIIRATEKLGYVPDVRNPRSLNEKIIHRKLFAPPRDAHILADKFAVRSRVAALVGERYLIPLIAVYESADEIDLARLPKSFVIKANHTCGRHVIVTDRDTIDPEWLRRECRAFLATGFGEETNEHWYRDMPRRLVVEELLVEEGLEAPLDYKFFVFDGRPAFVQVDFDRFTAHTRTLYTPTWDRIDVAYEHPPGPHIARPALLDEMLTLAGRLAGDLDFVRVDLYSPAGSGRIYVGEFTFAPAAGWGRFGPTKEVDFRFGEFWRLDGSRTAEEARAQRRG